ncbi:MAG: DUF5676 family membrane protein [Candidatus Pacearchaeota archaeon]
MNKNKLGLAVGILFAIIHAVWALAVLIIPGALQSFLNWVFKLHSLEPIWIITSFNFLNAIFLVVVTFIIGFIIGWVFAWVHNLLHKKKK